MASSLRRFLLRISGPAPAAGLEGQVLVAEVFDAVPEGFRTNHTSQSSSHHREYAHVFIQQPIIVSSEHLCQEVKITPRLFAASPAAVIGSLDRHYQRVVRFLCTRLHFPRIHAHK